MRRVFLILAVCAIAIAIAWAIAGLPGHVAVTLAGYTIETTTAFAVFGLLVIIAAVTALLLLLAALRRLPGRVGGWRGRRRMRTGGDAVTVTLLALAAGDRGEARVAARKARRLLGDTPQTLLLAAEAARLSGQETEAEEIYRNLATRDDAAFLGLRGLFRQAVAREDWAEAAALARKAEEIRPGGSWLREERSALAIRTGNWREALTLAAPDAPIAALTVGAAHSEPDLDEAMRLARAAWREDAGFTPAAISYAAALRKSGQEKKAQDVLRTAWAANPHPELATMALAPVTDPQARLKDAARLVQKNPEHAESRLLLARLSLEAGQLAEARAHAEAARKAGLTDRRIWLLVADLEAEQRGDTEEGRTAQRDALRRAATAEPEPTWRCTACGTEHSTWHPACPTCHTAGSVKWGAPARLALPAAVAS